MEQVQRAFQVEIREKLDNIEMRLPPAILSRKQAAKLLKVHVRTVDAALDSGKLREVRIEGGKGRFVDATSLRGVNVAAEIDRIKRGIYTTR
jgi:excisionase family DNA binding protein